MFLKSLCWLLHLLWQQRGNGFLHLLFSWYPFSNRYGSLRCFMPKAIKLINMTARMVFFSVWSAKLAWCLCSFSVHERADVSQVVHKVRWFGSRLRNMLSQTFWKHKPSSHSFQPIIRLAHCQAACYLGTSWLSVSKLTQFLSGVLLYASGKTTFFFCFVFSVQGHREIRSCQKYCVCVCVCSDYSAWSKNRRIMTQQASILFYHFWNWLETGGK